MIEDFFSSLATVIRIRDLTRRFGSKVALDNVSLTVQRGTV